MDHDRGGEGTDDKILRGENVVDVVAALASGSILVGSTAAEAIMIASTLPVMARLAFQLDQRAFRKRLQRGTEVLQAAATDLGFDAGDFEAKIRTASDPQIELVGRVIQAGAATVTLESKIKALGRALAFGLGDDAAVDEAFYLVRALEAMEVYDARVLGALANHYSQAMALPRGETLGGPGVNDQPTNRLRNRGWATDGDLNFVLTPGWKYPMPPQPSHERLKPTLDSLRAFGSVEDHGIRGGDEPRYGKRLFHRVTPFGIRVLGLLDFEIAPPLTPMPSDPDLFTTENVRYVAHRALQSLKRQFTGPDERPYVPYVAATPDVGEARSNLGGED